ncbi:MAG: T9SS type A sorting domain-containing protein, partial [Bacteroidota bacterium]
NYLVFIWQVDNWGPGEPLEGFQSTNGFVADADNDIDLDNNGSGQPFTDIMSGIVTLTLDGEPLDDGDPFSCLFNYDASGNNTIDFGFFDPNVTSVSAGLTEKVGIQFYPNPVVDQITITGKLSEFEIEIADALGRIWLKINPSGISQTLDLSGLPSGLYVLRALHSLSNRIESQKLIKE